MPNPYHLRILAQGAGVWNKWRMENPDIEPYLCRADLRQVTLRGRDLRYADLSEARLNSSDLSEVSLSRASLSSAILTNANLTGADLTEADLRDAKLSRVRLGHAVLSKTHLLGANLEHADMTEANLSLSDLRSAKLNHVKLKGAELGGSQFNDTTLVGNDLSGVKGLETTHHYGPSNIDISTIYISRGAIPEVFLRGCGLSDWEIEFARLHQPDLGSGEITDILYKLHDLRGSQAIQINPLFISYSHADSPFVNALEEYLNKKGIRFWRDVHNATAGRLETQIDRAIRLNPTVLLILSEQSVQSDWVQHEARLARKLEIETKRDVLCPVALDDSWKDCDWPKRLREQIMEYNILDFSEWKDEDKFRRMFGRLLDGLDLFYK